MGKGRFTECKWHGKGERCRGGKEQAEGVRVCGGKQKGEEEERQQDICKIYANAFSFKAHA